jgi:hypothetical protein
MKIIITALFLQLINLCLTIWCSIYGFLSFNKLNKNKILIFLPSLSLLQIIISEAYKLKFTLQNRVGNFEHITVSIYIIIEYIILVFFFLKTLDIKKNKFFKISILVFSVLLLINKIQENKTLAEQAYFSFLIFEGLTIEVLAFLSIINIFKKGKIEFLITDTTSLFSVGILFGFIIISPFSILQEYLINKSKNLYDLFFIANSIGYIIMYLFFLFSIYVSRRTNNN